MSTQNSSILLKRSGDAGRVPLAANLQFGELALNYADNLLFAKKSDGTVEPLTIPPADSEIFVEMHGNDEWDGLTLSRPKRTIRAAINAASPNTCIKLGAGTFVEDNPLVMPQFTTLYGSGTRGTTIIPQNKDKNIIYVTNACYLTGFAFRDYYSPTIAVSYPDDIEVGNVRSATANTIRLSANSVTSNVLANCYREMSVTITSGAGSGQSRNIVSHNVSTQNVIIDSAWSTLPDTSSQYKVYIPVNYVPYPRTKRYSTYITASPYLYNLSSVTTTGTGFVVDGYLSAGLKSMVSAQFTQYNQGGDGFVVKNLGYAQLVSIYGICCNDAFRAETGGTASMGNCNINFGNRGIVAIGVSPLMLSANLAPSFSYNREKCTRDTGLIVDALAQDLLFSGNTQSTFAGIQYWNQSSYTGQIRAQLNLTINSIAYAQELAGKVVVNNTTGTRYQAAVSQVTGNSASGVEANTVTSDFQVILDILNNGTTGVTDIIIPNSIVANSNIAVQNAYSLLQSNKAYIQAEVVAYANSAKPIGWPDNFTYDNAKCKRDIGLIVDALAFDLQFPSANGNSQSTFAGLQYWAQSGLSIPAGELTATLNALANLKYEMQTVVTTTPEDNYIGSEVDIIINLLNGTTTPNTVTNLIVPNATSATSNANALAAYTAIQSARSTIQSTVLNYVTTTYPGLLDGAQQAKCSRDVGYIIDSICFDLKYNVDNTYAAPSNRQAIQSGIYYLGFSNVSAIPGESVPTTAAYSYLRSNLIPYIVTGQTILASSLYQSNVAQNVSGGIGTSIEYVRLQENVNTILSIISTGPNASANANIVPISLTSNSSANVQNTFNQLYANREFIKEEVVAYINSFLYDSNKCSRDVGYMVDSVSFDLKYGGNRQAVQSGVYYYGYTSNSAISGEIPQTTAAYNYLKKVTAAVAKGQTIELPYQTDFDQLISSSVGTNTETAVVNTNISIITNIINNGPSVAATPAPIGLIANTNPAVVNAATLLIANREFIQNEVTAYVDRFFPPQTGYLIAVKDVVPNTDPRTALSASTKPYVGLALNIAGEIDTAGDNVYRSSLSTRTDDELGLTSVEFQENLITEYPANTTVYFYQRSSLTASGQTFEYVGAGTNVLTALPRFGFGVIKKENQVVTSDGGVVYYTATDQFGNFQIGADLTINFNTGTLSGRTFTRSLFAQITPFILALTND
jgi:hypothetical protein